MKIKLFARNKVDVISKLVMEYRVDSFETIQRLFPSLNYNAKDIENDPYVKRLLERTFRHTRIFVSNITNVNIRYKSKYIEDDDGLSKVAHVTKASYSFYVGGYEIVKEYDIDTCEYSNLNEFKSEYEKYYKQCYRNNESFWDKLKRFGRKIPIQHYIEYKDVTEYDLKSTE